jgi:hypothetical protein
MIEKLGMDILLVSGLRNRDIKKNMPVIVRGWPQYSLLRPAGLTIANSTKPYQAISSVHLTSYLRNNMYYHDTLLSVL